MNTIHRFAALALRPAGWTLRVLRSRKGHFFTYVLLFGGFVVHFTMVLRTQDTRSVLESVGYKVPFVTSSFYGSTAVSMGYATIIMIGLALVLSVLQTDAGVPLGAAIFVYVLGHKSIDINDIGLLTRAEYRAYPLGLMAAGGCFLAIIVTMLVQLRQNRRDLTMQHVL